MDAEKTGKLIRDLRIKAGMTQQELAEALNISPTAISKWENGHSLPDISMLEPIADKLNVSISEIIIGEMEMEQSSESSAVSEQPVSEAADIDVKAVIEESIIDGKRWVRRRNSIRSRAEEVILAELVYA